MDFLIFFYDNALIYYPNVFFAVLFFVSILGIVLVCIGIIVLWKKIKGVIEEIKSNLKQIGRIKINERKRISFVYIIKFLTISFLDMIGVFLTRINTTLGYIESRTEKIIKKIEKEVFVQE